jgi:hypothetical protein
VLDPVLRQNGGRSSSSDRHDPEEQQMTPTTTPPDTGFGDMNGPLAYWGPAEPSPATAFLSAHERATLVRVRARLADVSAGRMALTSALDTLLARSGAAGAAAA